MKVNIKKKIINNSLDKNIKYTENGLTYTELIRQEYGNNNCIISAGFVEGESKPEVDIIYIRLEKDKVQPTVLLLRPDEAQAIAWISSGVIWSYLINEIKDEG